MYRGHNGDAVAIENARQCGTRVDDVGRAAKQRRTVGKSQPHFFYRGVKGNGETLIHHILAVRVKHFAFGSNEARHTTMFDLQNTHAQISATQIGNKLRKPVPREAEPITPQRAWMDSLTRYTYPASATGERTATPLGRPVLPDV
jgi:hypothetical protein